MAEPLTADRMRAVEKAAIDSGRVTGLDLMERAGRGVVEAILETRPELTQGSHRAIVLCGPGNNGGDGYVVARLLHERGWKVEVFALGDPARLPPDALANHDRWAALGPVDTVEAFRHRAEWKADIIVDALFGIGLSRPIDDPGLQDLLWRLTEATDYRGVLDATGNPDGEDPPPLIVSIDVPSGWDADKAEPVGPRPIAGFENSVTAGLTVTFHAPKPIHVCDDAADICGTVVVKDIGL